MVVMQKKSGVLVAAQTKKALILMFFLTIVVVVLAVNFHPIDRSYAADLLVSASSNNASRRAHRSEGSKTPTTACRSVPESDKSWIKDLHDSPCRRIGHSQGNQDCMLDAIFQRLGATNKFFVEYGFNMPEQCAGSGPNTCKLWQEDAWDGLLLDGDNENTTINLKKHFLYSNNIVSILKENDVPPEFDFLSSDMDSHDYFVLANLLDHFSPRVITTEYNSNWPMDYSMSQVDPILDPVLMNETMHNFEFKRCIWGASANSLKRLLEKHNYVLIGVTPTLDLFWARRDVVDCYNIPDFDYFQTDNRMELGKLHHPKQIDLSFLIWLADTEVWEETNDIDKARAAAKEKIVASVKEGTHLPCFEKVKDLLMLE